jgi:putative oxidoreductase
MCAKKGFVFVTTHRIYGNERLLHSTNNRNEKIILIMNKLQKTMPVLARLVTAVILLQTLFFKFTAAPESVYIFTTVGIEPWGRIGSGVAELIAAILILIPATVWAGALIAIGVISGALITHITILGIVVMDDGGTLFVLACIVFILSNYLLYLNRDKVPVLSKYV